MLRVRRGELLDGVAEEAKINAISSRRRGKRGVQSLQNLEAREKSPLPILWHLCAQNGPSLSLDWQLCWLSQHEAFLLVYILLGLLWHRIFHYAYAQSFWSAWWPSRSQLLGQRMLLGNSCDRHASLLCSFGLGSKHLRVNLWKPQHHRAVWTRWISSKKIPLLWNSREPKVP